MSENPLMKYVRKKSGFYKLPSDGSWYEPNMIEYNQLGEVEVFPMVSSDEILMVNPDGLLSGQSVIDLVKSCCPSIHNPEELLYPDLNFLLLAIRKETYGNKIEQQGVCPKCFSKKVEIMDEEYKKILEERKIDPKTISKEQFEELYKEVEEKIAGKISEMENKREIMVSPQVLEYDIGDILATSKQMPKESIVEFDGLKVYVTPFKCKDKIKFMNFYIQQQKLIKYTQEKEINSYETIEEENFKKQTDEVIDLYSEYSKLLVSAYATCISKIVTPDGDIVSDKENITEFLDHVDVKFGNMIKKEIDDLNKFGIPSTLKFTCSCCGHEWDEKFYGYNQSDFFGISS